MPEYEPGQYVIQAIAALELVQRAMQSASQSCANLLIDSAYRLDNSIPKEELKAIWIENWMQDNQNRSKA